MAISFEKDRVAAPASYELSQMALHRIKKCSSASRVDHLLQESLR